VGVIKFALKMLKKEMKQSVFYLVSMIFSTAIIFNNFNLLFNPDFKDKESAFILVTIGFVVLGAALLLIAVANLYFINGKIRLLSIALISGKTFYSVGMLLGIQKFVIGIIGGIAGIILGFATMPLTNIIAYSALGEAIKPMALSSEGILCTISILVIELIIMNLADVAYAYRMEIVDLLKGKNIKNHVKGISFPMKGGFYWFFYLVPILCLFLPISIADKSKLIPIAELLVLIATLGIISTSIPQTIKNYKKKSCKFHKIKAVALSNLISSIEGSKYVIVYLLLSVTCLVMAFIDPETTGKVRIVIMISYVVSTAIMAITIIYKVLIEAVDRKSSFKQLQLVGYTDNEINKVLSLEVFLLYCIIIVIPIVQILPMVICSVMAGNIPYILGIIMVSIYIGTFGLTYIISLKGYKKMIFKNLGEVK